MSARQTLMAPGLQLGQFCTKSGKTKARHVKMLILSLLSKSLPIKGRGGQAGRVSGRAENMPRNTQTRARRGERDTPLVVSGDEDGDAAPRRLNEDVYDALREKHRSFINAPVSTPLHQRFLAPPSLAPCSRGRRSPVPHACGNNKLSPYFDPHGLDCSTAC